MSYSSDDVVERLMATTLDGSSDVVSISRSTVDCNSETFWPQGSLSGKRLFCMCVPDKDLCGRYIVLLQSTVL